jgi:hypothetical protein
LSLDNALTAALRVATLHQRDGFSLSSQRSALDSLLSNLKKGNTETMFDLPDPGLYRTTEPLPGHEQEFPANVLVYVGNPSNGGVKFVVRPGRNTNNRWYWGEPITPLRSPSWAKTLKAIPSEGFYTLPETLELGSGGRWLKNAIVQLGYNESGRGILFVAERRDGNSDNALYFSDRGVLIDDSLLERLVWAPILLTSPEPQP